MLNGCSTDENDTRRTTRNGRCSTEDTRYSTDDTPWTTMVRIGCGAHGQQSLQPTAQISYLFASSSMDVRHARQWMSTVLVHRSSLAVAAVAVYIDENTLYIMYLEMYILVITQLHPRVHARKCAPVSDKYSILGRTISEGWWRVGLGWWRLSGDPQINLFLVRPRSPTSPAGGYNMRNKPHLKVLSGALQLLPKVFIRGEGSCTYLFHNIVAIILQTNKR
jgi:hypothetical protein